MGIHVYEKTWSTLPDFVSPHPQCLCASLLIITPSSLCQAGCWEQMSFQNAAPFSRPLLSNCRKTEKGGGGQALTLPQVEEGQLVRTGHSVEFLLFCPKAQQPFLPASTPSKSQNSRTSKADRCFLNCSHSSPSYHLYYYLIGTFFYIDSLSCYLNAYFSPILSNNICEITGFVC